MVAIFVQFFDLPIGNKTKWTSLPYRKPMCIRTMQPLQNINDKNDLKKL